MLRTWILYILMLLATAFLNKTIPGYISSISFYVILVIPFVSLSHIVFSYFAFLQSNKINKTKISKGDNVEYTIKLINPSSILLVPYSLHYISSKRLFTQIKDEEDNRIIIDSKSRVTLKKRLTCAYRGTYSIGVDEIILNDYFGFFKLKYSDIKQHKILVYPKLRELKSNLLRNVINESSESVISNDTQNMSVFTDVRAYQPGDPFNRIHWKLSAKIGEFISKDYSGQITNKTKVFLDTYNMNLTNEDAIVFEDYLVEGCVSLIHFLLENRINTHLYYEKININKLKGTSNNDFSKFYDELAKISFYNENHFINTIWEVLNIEQDSCHVVIISQNISVALAKTLIKLKYQNYEVSIIVCDVKALELEDIESYADKKAQFLLATSKIPIYRMQHNENSTVLGVS